jgi:hypothetical protein
MVLLSDLCMKLVQHDKGGVLAAPQRAELVVLVPRHRQEGVPPVHKVTLHKSPLVIVQNHRQSSGFARPVSFLGLPDPDQLVRGTDPGLCPSISMQR